MVRLPFFAVRTQTMPRRLAVWSDRSGSPYRLGRRASRSSCENRPRAGSLRGTSSATRSRRWLRARPADVIDLFVYVVVLNLAIEYVPSVISEGFTLSLLTAVLLKLVLEVVIILKTRVIDRARAATTKRGKGAAAVTLWAVAAGSKLVVLKLVDLVFADAVSLGGFIPVTLLVLGLLASRAAVRRLLYDNPTPV